MPTEYNELIAAYAEAWDAEHGDDEKWALIYRGTDMFKEIDERIAFAIIRAYDLGIKEGEAYANAEDIPF